MKIILCALALCAMACTNTSTFQPNVAQVDGNRHVVVRAEAGRLWWAHRTWTEPHELCALPSNGPVENLKVDHEGDGFVVSFDQGGTTWTGTFGSEDATRAVVARAGSNR